ncbi:F-box-like domain-containing protein [Rhizoctonia solani AG-1 IA]|uniref:F-box-like domain-containing protein n=1 Tax=Thanatephorus cucumeris (strain AG1-IA) TaxID=983506 RepID=L8WSL2_THACA|nr:F-box-like domain-containing protein [Rhizoctonia solani AG-1 IA]
MYAKNLPTRGCGNSGKFSNSTKPSTEDSLVDKLEPDPHIYSTVPLRSQADYFIPLVNTLPTEILICIFKYSHYLWWSTPIRKDQADSPAIWDRSIRNIMRLGCPENLSHVCTLWRQIVLSTPAMWSSLNILTLGRSPQTFLDRASAFVPRAQNQKISLCLALYHYETTFLPNIDELKDFFRFTSPRPRELLIDNYSDDTAFFTSLIQTTISKATPGILHCLCVTNHCRRTQQGIGIEGTDDWELPTAESCGVSQQLLDSILRPITSLRLSNNFFPWSSPAYHGLVKLHLLFTRSKRGRKPHIHVDKLRDMLLASPALRVLHINIIVIGKDEINGLAPVPLNELEELSLDEMSRDVYDVVLPLLAPGTKPLQFTFQMQQEFNAPLYCTTVAAFLERTNVTSLYILGRSLFDQRLSVDELMTKSPGNIRTLGLEYLQILEAPISEVENYEGLGQLSRLYMRKCVIDVDEFKKLAGLFRLQMLKLHKPEFRGRLKGNDAEARQEIMSIAPTVKWVRSTRGMDRWDG